MVHVLERTGANTLIAFDTLPDHTKKTLSEVTADNSELVLKKKYFVIAALISHQLVTSVFNVYLFGMNAEINKGLSALENLLSGMKKVLDKLFLAVQQS